MDVKAEAAQVVRSVELTDFSRLTDLLEHLKRKAFRKKGKDYKWPNLVLAAEDASDIAAELGYALLKAMACKASFKGRFKCASLLIPRCGNAGCQSCACTGGGHRIDADMPLPLVVDDLVLLLCANRRGHEVTELTSGLLLVHVKRSGFTGCHINIGNRWSLQTVYVGAHVCVGWEVMAVHNDGVERARALGAAKSARSQAM
jgi:hypothetical protein